MELGVLVETDAVDPLDADIYADVHGLSVVLAVLKRVQPDGERNDEPPVDVGDLGLQFEHLAVAQLSEDATVRPYLATVAAEDEVERHEAERRQPLW